MNIASIGSLFGIWNLEFGNGNLGKDRPRLAPHLSRSRLRICVIRTAMEIAARAASTPADHCQGYVGGANGDRGGWSDAAVESWDDKGVSSGGGGEGGAGAP